VEELRPMEKQRQVCHPERQEPRSGGEKQKVRKSEDSAPMYIPVAPGYQAAGCQPSEP
jgi:hypothetical protein